MTVDLVTNFANLYDFLQTSIKSEHHFLSILEKSRQKYGKIEWLESVFRLFSILGLVDQFEDFIPCKGNFNLATIQKMDAEDYYDFFNKSCKDSGDSSDLTLEHKTDKTRIICSVKNRDSKIGELDIDKMTFHQSEYVDFNWIYCIVCPDKKTLIDVIKRSKKTSHKFKSVLENAQTIFLDYSDMYKCFIQLRQNFSNYSANYLISHLDDFLVLKPIMQLRFHQEMSVNKIVDLLNSGKKSLLLGQITRSGKSYCMAGCISALIEGANQEKLSTNVIIVSTDPNDTFGEYEYILKTFHQFRNVSIVKLSGKIKENPSTTNHTVFLASKQFLDDKINGSSKIKWLSRIDFDLAFVDEVHFGGTTQLADKALKTYLKDCATIYITATYRKPVSYYNIPKSEWILWDMEDISQMKDLRNNISSLTNKHGEYFTNCLEKFSNYLPEIEEEYVKNYPTMVILTTSIKEDTKKQIQDYYKDSQYDKFGFSASALMKTSGNKFSIEGTTSEFVLTNYLRMIFDESKPLVADSTSLFAQISKYDTRQFTSENCLAILVYLPLGTIKETAIAFQNFMKKHNILPNFIFCDLCNQDGNIRKIVNEHRQIAINGGKQGIIILSGNKVRLGITISFCDAVVMLSNSESADDILQRYARCNSGCSLTTSPKRFGFVIDPSLNRTLKWAMDYASTLKPNLHIKDAFKYTLDTHIFELTNVDFSGGSSAIVDEAYKIWTQDLKLEVVKDIVKDYLLKNQMSEQEIEQIQSLLSFNANSQRDTRINTQQISNEAIGDGIERKRDVTGEKSAQPKEEQEQEEQTDIIKISEIINHIVPLLCIFTLDCPLFTIDQIVNFLKEREDRIVLICNQIEVWWGKKIDNIFYNSLMDFIENKFKQIPALQDIFKEMKQIFLHTSKDRQQFSQALDKYLNPTELEIKNNAEIPTPWEVRKIVLDFYPSTFWSNPNAKILEESCGKGLFLVDIIDRFMDGLKEKFPNEKQRYQHIVNNMLYFSDINETNIFICNLLLKIPAEEIDIQPNSNIGNTLELNPTDKWNIPSFTSILGNPPYEEVGDGARKAKNHNLWSKFLEYAEEWTAEGGFIAQITPCSWMSPTSKVNNIFSSYFVKNLEVETINDFFRSNGKKVGSKFSCYLIEKRLPRANEFTTVNCVFNKSVFSSECNLFGRNFYPILLNKESLSIIDKFYNNELEKISFKTSSELHDTNKKGVLNNVQTDEFKYPIKHTSSKQRWSKIKHSIQEQPKILLNLSGNLNPVYDSGVFGVTQATMFAFTENAQFAQVLERKIYKFIFTICKWSGFNIEEIFKNIPMIPTNKTDAQLYKLFKLTKNEQQLIEQTI